MIESQYSIRKAVDFPTRDKSLPLMHLLPVQHRGRELLASYPAFGPDFFHRNVAEMQRTYAHSQKLPQITFREPTTSQSVSIANYGFGSDREVDARRDIFDQKWLQAGRIARTNEGVIANPPRDANGNVILDMAALKRHIDQARKIKVENGYIYLGSND